MAIPQVSETVSMDQVRSTLNLVANNVGDLVTLTTTDKTSLVGAINELDTRIDNLVIDNQLLNNTFFKADDNAGTGTVDILKVNTSDVIEFGADVASITITGGTITGITDLAIADGGTGASSASGARTALGLIIGTDVQAHGDALDDIKDLTPTNNHFIAGNGSAWIKKTASESRTALGLVIGTDVQAYHALLYQFSQITPTDGVFAVANGATWVGESGSTARSSMGVAIGSDVQAHDANLDAIAGMATTANNFIMGNGSTFALTDPANVRTALNLVVGTTVQAYDINLDQLAGLTPSSDYMIYGNGSSWTTLQMDGSSMRSKLGLAIGTDVQAHGDTLDDIKDLSPTNNYFLSGNGSSWIAESAANARTSLGLGSIATINSPVPIANGGTGSTSASAALTALGAAEDGSNSDITSLNTVSLLKRTSNGNITFEVPNVNQFIFKLSGSNRWIIGGGTQYPIYPGSTNGLYDIGLSGNAVRDIYFTGKLEHKGTSKTFLWDYWSSTTVNSIDPSAATAEDCAKAINHIGKILNEFGLTDN